VVFGLLEHVGQGAQHLLHDGNGGVVQRAGHGEFTSKIGRDGRSWRGRGSADHARLTAQGELDRPGFCGQLFFALVGGAAALEGQLTSKERTSIAGAR
jgi:hypothetical protein